mgnify:FL=1|jgi:hypothetical protein|tara:strand:+ start:4691 stop:4942 length:252 start_codon:yes stop_codon:yes gene_type:complete
MNAKTDEIIYFSVYTPGGVPFANFRSKEAAETFAAQERSRRVAKIEEEAGLLTQGEYRGAMNFATHGVTVRTVGLVFEDSVVS